MRNNGTSDKPNVRKGYAVRFFREIYEFYMSLKCLVRHIGLDVNMAVEGLARNPISRGISG